MEEKSYLEERCEDFLSEINEYESDNDEDTELVAARHRSRVMCVLSSSSSSETEIEIEEEDTDWSDFDPARNNENFEGIAGVKIFPDDPQSVADVTSLFIGDDLFEKVILETNSYHRANGHKYKNCAHGLKWVDVTVPEIKKLFALTIIMGLVRKNNLQSYWSKHPLIATPLFSKTMSRDRFLQILTFLHFSDNTNIHPNANRLVNVQEIIDYFLNKFRSVYEPEQNLLFDQGIIPWRGRLQFQVYNPSKIIKHGILNTIVCESKTGYICNLLLSCGKNMNLENTIMNIMDPYLNKWHHLYADNFYNSVNLASNLLLKKVRICGTIRTNCGIPNSLKNITLRRGETCYKRKGEIMLQIWKSTKNRNIQMISTIHNAKMINTNKIDCKTQLSIQKPYCIMDYNNYMNSIDLIDQYLPYNPIFRKTLKWPKNMFFYLLRCALFNSFRVFQKLNPASKMKFHSFLLNTAQTWLEEIPHTTDSEDIEETMIDQPSTSVRAPRFDPPERLTGKMKQHEPIKIFSKNKNVRRKCRVCYSHKIRRDTFYMCKYCKVPLHLGNCFQAYHTKKKY